MLGSCVTALRLPVSDKLSPNTYIALKSPAKDETEVNMSEANTAALCIVFIIGLLPGVLLIVVLLNAFN